MPITDNSFTAAELAAAATANPALIAEIKAFGTAQGAHFRTKEEQVEYEKNFESSIVAKKTSEFANNIEKDIFETFGEAKQENEKYHEYLKRVGTTHKSTLASMKTELEALKAGKGDEVDKSRIKQLEDAIVKEKQDWAAKLADKENEINTLRNSNAIEKSLSPLRGKYEPSIPKSVVDTFESNVIRDVSAKLKQIDGKMMIIGEDGNPILDTTTYQPKSIEAYLEEKLADVLAKGKQQGGAGSGNQPPAGVSKDANGKVTEVTAVPATVKTKVELTAHLLQLGLVSGTKEYTAAFEKFGKDLPLR